MACLILKGQSLRKLRRREDSDLDQRRPNSLLKINEPKVLPKGEMMKHRRKAKLDKLVHRISLRAKND